MMKARNLRPRDRLSANCHEESELCRADSEGSKLVVVYSCNCLREQARAYKNAIARPSGRVCGQSRLLVDAFHGGPRLPSRAEPNSNGLHRPYRTISINRHSSSKQRRPGIGELHVGAALLLPSRAQRRPRSRPGTRHSGQRARSLDQRVALVGDRGARVLLRTSPFSILIFGFGLSIKN
jgi:hypothetical protein